MTKSRHIQRAHDRFVILSSHNCGYANSSSANANLLHRKKYDYNIISSAIGDEVQVYLVCSAIPNYLNPTSGCRGEMARLEQKSSWKLTKALRLLLEQTMGDVGAMLS
jgi:hypothetical protein